MSYTPSVTNGQFVTPANYGVGSTGAASQLVTASVYDLFPTDLTQLFERNLNGVGYRLLIKLMGFSRGVTAPTTGHYETGRNIDPLTVGAIVTPSAGAGTSVVISLDASSMFSFTDTLGNTLLGSFPRVGDVIKTKGVTAAPFDAQIIAKNTTVNPHQVTLRPLNSANDLAGELAAGEDYFIAYSLFAEGTDIPTAVQRRVIKYTNTFGLVKEAAVSTGSNLTTRPYFDPVPGRPGTMFLRDADDMYMRFEEKCDNMLIFGEQSNNITVTPVDLDYAVPVSGTEGMLTFLENYAFQDFIIPGLQQIQNFDDVSSLLKFERTLSNKYLVLQGYTAYQTYENVFADYANKYLTDFIVTPETEDGDVEIKLNVGAYGLNKGGYQYRLKEMPAFNDNKGAALPGYQYPNYSVFLPLDYVTNKSTNTAMPTVGYEYRELNGYSRENKIVQIDGTGYTGLTTTTVDIHKVGIMGELASHCTSPNNCVIQKPQ